VKAASRSAKVSGRTYSAISAGQSRNRNNETEIRTYICQIENRGPRTATIGGIAIDARLMAEVCQNLDQQFLNLYWVSSASNQIVQSRQ